MSAASPLGPDPARAALDARVLAWMREPDWTEDEARFDALALELFAFQFAHCEPYRRFCEGRGRSPSTVACWRDIPAVPAGAFKEVPLRSFSPTRTAHTFCTSGTSAAGRGALHLDTLEIYEASLLPTFQRHVLPDLPAGERATLRILAPSPAEAPDSSLSHMFGAVLERLGSPESGFDVEEGSLRLDRLLDAFESPGPIALCGTAFALVHLLDAMEKAGRRVGLAPGSRVMETGGFKGRSRELTRDTLYTSVEERLGVPPERCVNQYGMTELGSQFYDSVLRQPGAMRRKLRPPWTRVRALDPETGREVPLGDIGAIAILDLANTGSVCAVQTADLGRRIEDGFEVIGREPGAEARGCSIAADADLGRRAPGVAAR